MNTPGRPLRFLGYLLGGWVSLRAASLLLPAMWGMAASTGPGSYASLRPVRDGGGPAARVPQAAMMVERSDRRRALAVAIPAAGPAQMPRRQRIRQAPVMAMATGWTDNTANLLLGATLGFVQSRLESGIVDQVNRIVQGSDGRAEGMLSVPIPPVAPSDQGQGRWAGTAWILWRPEMGGSFVQAPLLGGSQAGARIDYRLTGGTAGQLSLYGRVSRAFIGPSSEEAALGIAWRLGDLPVSLLAERRQRLGPGGRNGFAFIAAGGFGPQDIVPRLEAEGYAQAGIVGFPGADGFADGKASLGYRLTRAGADPRLTLGASLSGSIQPGAERVDIGPELRLRFPLGATSMRLSTEWRARIAGDARPSSGPAITLVADF
jgi:hypothetical protein